MFIRFPLPYNHLVWCQHYFDDIMLKIKMFFVLHFQTYDEIGNLHKFYIFIENVIIV